MDAGTHKADLSKARTWLKAMRLRTLPLALASTFTGSFLAMEQGHLSGVVMLLTALTTVLLQVNSNLANDYGDFQHGTDNDSRVGPERTLQSGGITPKAMHRAIVLFSVLALLSGSALLWVAKMNPVGKAVLFVLGLAAIYASIGYTAGKKPYGYRGLGDLSVMLFFGLLGVVGAFFLQTGYLDPMILLPAISIGCFSAGVLNINNTRDIKGDEESGKITLAVKLGPQAARKYHVFLLSAGMLFMCLYAGLRFETISQWLFVVVYPLLLMNAVKVYKTTEAVKLDPMLKQLAITTFVFSLLLGLGITI